MGSPIGLLVEVEFQNRTAYRNAFVTNVGARVIARRGNESLDNALTLVAKRAARRIVRFSAFHAAALNVSRISAPRPMRLSKKTIANKTGTGRVKRLSKLAKRKGPAWKTSSIATIP